MFLLDSLLMAPGNAAFVLFKQLARKAQEEWLDDDSVKQELQELYLLLEAGRISDRDFEARECRLLERLEQIARAKFRDKWGAEEGSPVMSQSELQLGLPAADVILAQTLPSPPDPESNVLPPAPSDFAFAATPPPLPTPSPLAVPPPVAMAPPPIAGEPLTVFQVLDSTTRALAMLKLRVSSVTSVSKADEGWKVTAELVERKGVPDTNDLLGVYELRLDAAGAVVSYERTRMRRRGDLSRG
jgi:hypothetical protein